VQTKPNGSEVLDMGGPGTPPGKPLIAVTLSNDDDEAGQQLANLWKLGYDLSQAKFVPFGWGNLTRVFVGAYKGQQ